MNFLVAEEMCQRWVAFFAFHLVFLLAKQPFLNFVGKSLLLEKFVQIDLFVINRKSD